MGFEYGGQIWLTGHRFALPLLNTAIVYRQQSRRRTGRLRGGLRRHLFRDLLALAHHRS